jgi:hypothetical protein
VPLSVKRQNDRDIVFFIMAPLVVGVVRFVKGDHEVRLHGISIEVIGDDLGIRRKFLNELLQGRNAAAEIGTENEYARHVALEGKNIEDSIFNNIDNKATANNIPVTELVIVLHKSLNDRNSFCIIDRENSPVKLHTRHPM